MDLLHSANEKNVLLVAHRGTCGGNIPCNSLPAFKAAILAGADMVELDVEKCADGVLFVQHPGMEPVHLRMKDSIKRYPASVLDQFRLSNWDHVVTQYPLLRLEEALSYLKGKCFVNVDKFWENPKEIAALIHKLGMEDQILIKTDCKPEYLDAVEEYAPDIPFMGITRGGLDIHEELMRRRLRYVGLETLFESEDAENASGRFIQHLHSDGKIVWVNAIVYNDKVVLAGGHNDDTSLSEDPELGWGWLADRGFDLIQTDFVYQCRRFLEETGRRGDTT